MHKCFKKGYILFLVLGLSLLYGLVSIGEYCPMRFYDSAELFPDPPLIAIGNKAYALPNFGRKYDMDCIGCHTQGVFPRLNDVGYKFRRAGFRMPEEIGKSQNKKFSFGDYFAASGQDSFRATFERDSNTGVTRHNAAFEAGEFIFYPLNGSLGKYFATQGEFNVNTEGDVELENSNARFVYGNDHNFFTMRGGVFHALEGYGASDRPIGLNFPLFMQAQAAFNQETLFTMVEPSLLGLELGYSYKNTNISVAVTNSIRPKVHDDEVEGTHFFREENKPADVQITFHQILGSKGSGLTAYYYTGSSRLPVDPDGFVERTEMDLFANRFHQAALFGTYYPWDRLALLGGFSLGRNKFFDPATESIGGSFTNLGAFGEVDFYPMSGLGLGVRYDFFDPAQDIRNTQQAASLFVNYTPIKFFQVILDYQFLTQQLDPIGTLAQHNIVTRVMFLY